jgi:2-methylcitrate dehydratase PrpD
LELMAADVTPTASRVTPAVPDGLAIKLYPCCYALQRPIQAIRTAVAERRPEAAEVHRIVVVAPPDALRPLIHDRPVTGFEGKFSLPYGVAAALLDEHPGFGSFTDAAVRRPDAKRLVELVEVQDGLGFGGLLAGVVSVEVHTGSGVMNAQLEVPLGAPSRPASDTALFAKVADCAGADAERVAQLTWADAGNRVPALVLG